MSIKVVERPPPPEPVQIAIQAAADVLAGYVGFGITIGYEWGYRGDPSHLQVQVDCGEERLEAVHFSMMRSAVSTIMHMQNPESHFIVLRSDPPRD